MFSHLKTTLHNILWWGTPMFDLVPTSLTMPPSKLMLCVCYVEFVIKTVGCGLCAFAFVRHCVMSATDTNYDSWTSPLQTFRGMF